MSLAKSHSCTHRIGVYLLLFSLSFACQTLSSTLNNPLPKPLTSIRFRVQNNHILVKVKINNSQPLTFIVDTGASISVIDEKAFGLIDFGFWDGRSASVVTADGKLDKPIPIYQASRFHIGKKTFEQVSLAVFDLSPLARSVEAEIHGIIGLSFMNRIDLEIDFMTRVLKLYAPETEWAGFFGGKQVSFSYTSKGLIRVDVGVEDTSALFFEALLDLGSSNTIMNWYAANEIGIQQDSSKIQRKLQILQGAQGKSFEIWQKTFDALYLGSVRFHSPTLYISDLPIFQNLGFQKRPGMIVGNDLLSSYRLVFEFTTKTLHLFPKTDLPPQLIHSRNPTGPQNKFK